MYLSSDLQGCCECQVFVFCVFQCCQASPSTSFSLKPVFVFAACQSGSEWSLLDVEVYHAYFSLCLIDFCWLLIVFCRLTCDSVNFYVHVNDYCYYDLIYFHCYSIDYMYISSILWSCESESMMRYYDRMIMGSYHMMKECHWFEQTWCKLDANWTQTWRKVDANLTQIWRKLDANCT